MGGGTGTGPKSLEEKAVEIEVQGDPQKIIKIQGSVESVSGFNAGQKFLHISLDSKTSTPEKIGLLKFYGESPVRRGDIIRAGLILEEDVKEYGTGRALYVEIMEKDGSLTRRDFMDGYNPMQHDVEKLGLR